MSISPDWSALRQRFRAGVARRFGVDARALAALRFSLGALVLVDLAARSRWLRAFYTDDGALPRSLVREEFAAVHSLSLHALSGDLWVQVALFAVAGVFAAALAVGYRTRVATLGTFVFVVSMQARAPVLLNSGDVLLRRLLFWALFLPLGARWSIDARRASGGHDAVESDQSGEQVATLATAGLLIQVAAVYVVNVVFKLRGDQWLTGEALRHVFSLDKFTVFLGPALAGQRHLLAALEWGWLALLLAAPGLILLVGRARAVLAALFAAGHVGMALTLQLGIFPLVSVVALVPFLPASAWDRLPTRRAEDLGERIADPLDASLPRGRLAGRVPALPRVRRRLATPLLASLVAVLILWNAAAVGVLAAPSEVQSVTRDRTWDMFAPAPPQADGWYVAAGRLDSGRKVDALRGGALRSGPPPNAAQTYPTSRWRKYLDALRGNAALRPPLAGYLCDRWDRTRDGDLATVSLSYVRQPTRFDGPEPIERVELGTYACEGDGLTASEARNGTTGTQEPSDHRAEGRV